MSYIKYILIVVLFISIANEAYSQDRFNTYRWNHKNVARKNGKIDKSTWYEWWYYKVVIPKTGESFFFVYGIVNPWDKSKSMKGTRSYVGMGDFKAKIQAEEKFDISDFHAAYDRTYVEVKNNIATDRRFFGDLKDEQGEKYSWDIQIQKKWSFNAEGWMMGTMITDIEWYPAQADATCSGSVMSKGKLVEFKDAPCYQDRNWGNRFPDWWTWIVSNNFEGHPNTTLAIGGGKPTLRGGHTSPYAGVSVGLKHRGKVYSFRPINFHKVKTDVTFGKWEVTATKLNYKVEIVATAPKEKFMDLQFMTPNGMIFHDYETLNGRVVVKLYKRIGLRGWRLMDVLISNHAGIEYGSRDLH